MNQNAKEELAYDASCALVSGSKSSMEHILIRLENDYVSGTRPTVYDGVYDELEKTFTELFGKRNVVGAPVGDVTLPRYLGSMDKISHPTIPQTQEGEEVMESYNRLDDYWKGRRYFCTRYPFTKSERV
jgi:hypothetical protein